MVIAQLTGSVGFVAQIILRTRFPLPRSDLSHALRDRGSEGREAVEDRGSDLEFCDLPFEVARHDALAQQFEAVHFGLDQTSSVIAAPVAPYGATKAGCGAQDGVAGIGTGRILFPKSAIAAGRDDGNGAPRGRPGCHRRRLH